MSTPTYQKIHEHAELHTSLAKRHIALQSAPGELNRHNEYLEGLLKQLKTSRENMERVSAVTRQENEVETKSISKAKRFWSRKNLKEKAREQTEQQERCVSTTASGWSYSQSRQKKTSGSFRGRV